MQDFVLTFSDETDAIQSLPEYRITTEEGDQWSGIITDVTRWITRPQYNEEGTLVVQPDKAPGWHCIIRAQQSPMPEKTVTDPGDIEPIPAGGLMSPQIPRSVSALQGRLAIKAAGLVPAFLAWKGTLDPALDFETIAFFDTAPTWDYDNQILDNALSTLGLLEQKPMLFQLAVSL